MLCPTEKYVAARIRSLRRRQRLTVKALAARCGISPVWLLRIERGGTNVPLRTLCRLCEVLGVAVQELLPAPEGFAEPARVGGAELRNNEDDSLLQRAEQDH